MTRKKVPTDKARSALAEGRLVLEEAQQRLEASHREVVALRALLAEATARFEELQRLVVELTQTFGKH